MDENNVIEINLKIKERTLLTFSISILGIFFASIVTTWILLTSLWHLGAMINHDLLIMAVKYQNILSGLPWIYSSDPEVNYTLGFILPVGYLVILTLSATFFVLKRNKRSEEIE